MIYEPWVGAEYADAQRMLVLGECPHGFLTPDGLPDLSSPSCIRFAKALVGCRSSLSLASRACLWNRVAFYAYVQAPLSEPRPRPTSAQLKLSEPAFWLVLERLQPRCVVVLGQRLYAALPGSGCLGERVSGPDGTAFETWVYKLASGGEVRVLGIDSPSVGFAPEYWHQVLCSFV